MDKVKITNILKKFNFVNWDRYYGAEGSWSFYGWIEREKDNYKDFILIEFDNNNEVVYHGTSSKKHTREIAEILNRGHSDCKRVEHFCDIPNLIRLKDKTPDT